MWNNNNIGDSRTGNIYSLVEYDSERNEISNGIVKIFEELEDSQFIFNKEGERNTLISNFGVSRYRCSGSCYCENIISDSRKSVVFGSKMTTLSRGIIFLLASASSVYVMDEAKTFYDGECINQFEDQCPSIISELDECEEMIQPTSNDDQQQLNPGEEEVVVKNGEELKRLLESDGKSEDEIDHMLRVFRKDFEDGKYLKLKSFWCKGSCLTKKINFEGEEMNSLGESFQCEKIEISGEVGAFLSDSYPDPLKNAIFEFVDTQVTPMCSAQSVQIVRYTFNGPDGNPIEKELPITFCEGRVGPKGLNPTVICNELV